MPSSVLNHSWQFETFGEPELTDMLTNAMEFARDMQNDIAPHWLVLCGNSGTGKTHLARRLFDWFKENLWRTQYVSRTNVVSSRLGHFDEWPLCVNKLKDGRYSIVDGLKEDWFQVIDDVGAERDPSKFGAEKLLEVLNGRRDKWTIITSNLFLDEMADKLDVRIASRLLRNGSKVVQCACKDYNLRLA